MAAGVLTVPRLFLGEALKRLRAESKKTLDETAAAIGKSRARLINVLDGKGTLTAEELARLLDFLGADPSKKSGLLALGAEARKRPTRRPYTDLLPTVFERIIDLQSMAAEIDWYERGVIPGLLQIPEYFEAIVADTEGIWWGPSWEQRRNWVTFHLERQRTILQARPAKIMRFVITDDALRTEVGDPRTMGRQLEHLLSLLDEWPNVSIQVLSSTASHNPAPSAGLILLRLGAQQHPIGFLPVAYGPSTYLDDPDDTERLARAFARVRDLAMPPDESRAMIATLLAQVGSAS
ncbi:MAG TPA: helix-turn-helix transcriptional regulator [Actinophytocola sp.]|uniref:helix-turn-helix domain-containing protein n=1 Tax=Actinophytocola sp. TaxID=1872138 RepID=UPI002DB78E2B|nr:helix-turn-helix transcriptional regulator [Actinophytocola sp.]HEU5472820.1 helix-turn-helix transcriptional regulator [Actinophytocola sp.]